VADELVVEGEQDQRAEQSDRKQEVRRRSGREAAAAEQRDVDQALRPPPGRMPNEEQDQRRLGRRAVALLADGLGDYAPKPPLGG
jgi:hypothetical protein